MSLPYEPKGLAGRSPKEKSFLREYGEALGFALILALIIRAFLFQAFSIPSGSMRNTLLVGDYLLVNKFIYGIRNPLTNKVIIPISNPHRGDVVVFIFSTDTSKDYIKQPPNSIYRDNPAYREPKDYIKRVIGLPGDTIQIKNKKLYINGKLTVIPPLPSAALYGDQEYTPTERDNFGPVMVPAGHYLVMGDNRDHSFDGRFWGFVSNDALLGKAMIIYFSWGGPHEEESKADPFFPSLMGGLKGLVTNWSWDSKEFHVRWSRLGMVIH